MVEIEDKKNLKLEKPRVMICLPTKGEMKTKMSDCLLRTFLHTMNNNITVTITYAEGTLVSAVRSVLVKRFLESDFEYLFFIDSDMIFEQDIIIRLLGLNKDIACGIAKVRGGKSFNVYHYVPEQEKYAPIGQINKPMVIKADATGCSCVLIKRCVFEDVLAKKQKLSEKFNKMKDETTDEFEKVVLNNYGKEKAAFNAIGEKSEDILFYELARACGYDIYCDLGLVCGHICDTVLK